MADIPMQIIKSIFQFTHISSYAQVYERITFDHEEILIVKFL